MSSTRQRGTGMTSRGLVPVLVSVLVAALLTVLSTGTAYAGWGRPPDTLSTSDTISSAPTVVIDGHRRSYAVWIEQEADNSVLLARVRRPGRAWGPTETVARRYEAGVDDVKVAPDGTLGVLWHHTVYRFHDAFEVTLFSTRTASGAWSNEPVANTSPVALAVDARGDFLLAGGSSAQFRPADSSRWRPVETIPVKDGTVTHVGLDNSGNATLLVLKMSSFFFGCDSSPCPLLAVERRRDGRWTSPRRLSTTFDNRRDSFAESPNGAATIAWRSQSGSVQAISRRADSMKWGPVRTLGTAADTYNPHTYPLTSSPVVTAMGPRGASTLIWLGTDQKVYTAHHTARGHWQRRTIGVWSSPIYSLHPDYPILLAAPDGSLAAEWWQGNNAVLSTRAGRSWTPSVRSPMGYLAVGTGAVATSSWAPYRNGAPIQGRYAVTAGYSPARPAPRSIRIPATGKVGQRLGFAVTVGSWLPATVTWRFGGDQVATGPKVHHTFRTAGKYRVTITITDTSNATTRVHRTITIKHP